MTNIELVIKMPEELYRAYKDRLMLGDAGMDIIAQAIANGKPLPKGHGKLKDADEIIKIITDVDGYERFENSNLFAKHYYDVVKDAPAIIEADKAESEEQE